MISIRQLNSSDTDAFVLLVKNRPQTYMGYSDDVFQQSIIGHLPSWLSDPLCFCIGVVKDDEIIDLFYLYFNDPTTIKISLNDDFENEIVTKCIYLQNRGNLFTKLKYDKQNIHEIIHLNEFYEFNTSRAHFEINEKYKQNKNYLIELNNKNLIKTSEITKAKVSIIKNYECKISR